MRRIRDFAETLFYTDWLFLSVLVGLPILSFLAVEPLSLRYSPELFFSALSAASIVVLAWDRIAESRVVQLHRLMRRVYLNEGEVKLYLTLKSIRDNVVLSKGPGLDVQQQLQRAVYILKHQGQYRGIDRLFPAKATDELQSLSQWIGEYVNDWRDWLKRIGEFYTSPFDLPQELLQSMAAGRVELREQNGFYVAYPKQSNTRDYSWSRVDRELGENAVTFVETLKQESKYLRRLEDGTWRREIIERVSRIRQGFNAFLEKHALEIPPGSYEDWMGGGVVIDYTGPIF